MKLEQLGEFWQNKNKQKNIKYTLIIKLHKTMYLTKEIRKKMEELMNLISPKKAETPKVEEKTEQKVETELAAEQKVEVAEPKVETLSTEETKVAETPKVETKVEEVALVYVPEETPAEEKPEEGMNIEETVQQLIEAITAIDTRLKSIEDAIGAKAQEIEQKNAELAKQVDELGIKLAKQNGFKQELKKEDKMVEDYYAKLKKQLKK